MDASPCHQQRATSPPSPPPRKQPIDAPLLCHVRPKPFRRNLNRRIYRGTVSFASIKGICAGLKAGRAVQLTATKKKLKETVVVRIGC